MKILEFYQDYHVVHQTEGHKHCRPGWVNTACPFCTGNPGLHLGAVLDGSRFYCWRCGWKPASKAIATLIGITEEHAKNLIREYGGISRVKTTPEANVRVKAFKFPSNIMDLTERHKRYLHKRGFDAEKLEEEWNLKATGVVSLLKTENKVLEYKHRILAPISWDDKIVTFQARDITDKHKLKYMACPKEREIIHHKHLLYGKQEAWGNGVGLCVEGIIDVWRFGPISFCTFGIEYTREQIRLMGKIFNRVAVVFDDEKQAVMKAEELVSELVFRGVDAFRIPIEGDPGAMKQDDANNLIKSII